MVKRKKRVEAHKKQREFIHSDSMFRAFIGGRGAGKTWSGAVAAIRMALVRPCRGVACAPSFPNLRDYVVPELLKHAGDLVESYNKSDHDIRLRNGSLISCRSAETEQKADAAFRGPSNSWFWLDEAREMDYRVWQIALPTLREGGRSGRGIITTTPNGKSHWIYEKFVTQQNEDYALFTAGTRDNPYLHEKTIKAIEDDYGVGAWAKQELGGEFVDPEGALFQRSDFKIVDDVPSGLELCRSWDLAVSSKTSADFTCGALLGIGADNDIYILDMVRVKSEWPETRKTIIQTALIDGDRVRILMEKVAFQAAAIQEMHVEKQLSNHIIEECIPDRDKLTRALPVASKARAGKVYLRRGAWNAIFLDEACSFTGDGKEHDDQVDAVSQAYLWLASSTSDYEVLSV
jgi:predicted phage terminase large subunit-like protein